MPVLKVTDDFERSVHMVRGARSRHDRILVLEVLLKRLEVHLGRLLTFFALYVVE